MNQEFDSLSQERQAAVRRVIQRALAEPHAGTRSEMLADGSEAYAYPGARGTHWGVNRASDGFNVKRGIWPKDQPA